jgi:lipooligosaccharide transport system permease protein
VKHSRRVLEHQLLVYRRTWRGGLFTTFLAPVLFLLAMGVGLGTFVDQSASGGMEGVPYLVFLAPGLLASQAMQTAAGEAMYPIMSAITWNRTFQSMISTPIAALDVVFGTSLWMIVRLAIVSTAFVIVMILFQATDVLRGIAMIPIAILTGLAFALPIMAFTVTRKGDASFPAINRFIITPLFIFSGVFFPVTQLPDFLQPIAFLTPLWNGVALARGIALGALDAPLAAYNLTVLAVYCAVGLYAATVTFPRRLVQ